MQPHPADELVADVDRHEGAGRRGAALLVQQQRLHIGFEEFREPGAPENGVPGLGVQFALGGARRAGVEGRQPVEGGVAEEEGEADGYLEPVPAGFVEREVGVGQIPVGHGPEAALPGTGTGEEHVAGHAGALQGTP